jgi:uncharacterized membrane protein
MHDIDLLLTVNVFFVCLASYTLYSIGHYMNTEGGEMGEGFGLILGILALLWHGVILFSGYMHKQKGRDDYEYDDSKSAGRLFIWTFLPWSIVFLLWMVSCAPFR